MKGYGVIWPQESFYEGNLPTDGQVFDLIEFSYEFIAEAREPSFHSYMSHSHYKYDRNSGRDRFANDVNRIFERNGIAFELKEGEIVRIVPAVLQEVLAETVFRTGDLDNLLEVSRQKIMNRALEVRREALEKIWDAWERLKTIEAGDKKAGIKVLLDVAAFASTQRRRFVATNVHPQCRRTFQVAGIEGFLGIN